MVEENNNNRASENGHLAHGAQSANAGKATPLTFYENLKSWVEAIADVMMFILCSIGFILKVSNVGFWNNFVVYKEYDLCLIMKLYEP